MKTTSSLAEKVELEFDTSIPEVMERDLLAKILSEAILDLTPQYARSLPVVVRRALINWLKSDEIYADGRRGFSFGWLCEQLDLDAKMLRARILANRIHLEELPTRRHLEDDRGDPSVISRAMLKVAKAAIASPESYVRMRNFTQYYTAKVPPLRAVDGNFQPPETKIDSNLKRGNKSKRTS